MDSYEFKARLTRAFKAMRQEGLIARQNYLCCRSCAGYDLGTRVSKMTDEERVAFKGAAFYTQQDGSGMHERRFQGLYIGYGQVGCHGHEKDYGLPTVEVGHVVKRCLEAQGLEVEWDGDEASRIWVRFAR